MRLYFVSLLMLIMAAAGCRAHLRNNLPPAERLMEPGPGVGGPGPGVSMYQPAMPCLPQTSQIAFVGPEGMHVQWDLSAPGMFDSEALVVPGRYNFPQGAIYRLKLSDVPGRPGVELYPTLEVGPALPRTEAFLAHNAIPVQFTEEDFDQVLSGNFVTKVIYLPDPEFQELAVAGVETLVSTRLEPGVDPIVEADRRGAILAIVRLGNKDLQIPGAGGQMRGGAVSPASYDQELEGLTSTGPVTSPGCQPGAPFCPSGGMVGGGAYPLGVPVGSPTTLPSTFIAGATAPQYGMPMSGTPIGLPGPPHVPLGIPAGLQSHVMKNHTRIHIPGPTEHVRVDVRQVPGFSYPKPPNHVRIVERTRPGLGIFKEPPGNRREIIEPGAGPACETGACPDGAGADGACEDPEP